MSDTSSPVTPRPSASVILLRQAPSTIEVFMGRRNIRMEFASDAYVFPGGSIDAGDRDPRLMALSRNGGARPHALDHLPYVFAGVRELFEEAGVLLAHDSRGDLLDLRDERVTPRFERYRREVHDGRTALVDVLSREGLTVAADRLFFFAHWITPEALPKRFSTHFYVAAWPTGQDPRHDQLETVSGEWIAPARALERSRRGDFPLVFATVNHLQRLTGFDTVEAVIEHTLATPVTAIMPRMIERDGLPAILLPGEPGYDD